MKRRQKERLHVPAIMPAGPKPRVIRIVKTIVNVIHQVKITNKTSVS